jgi:hypothetical protein
MNNSAAPSATHVNNMLRAAVFNNQVDVVAAILSSPPGVRMRIQRKLQFGDLFDTALQGMMVSMAGVLANNFSFWLTREALEPQLRATVASGSGGCVEVVFEQLALKGVHSDATDLLNDVPLEENDEAATVNVLQVLASHGANLSGHRGASLMMKATSHFKGLVVAFLRQGFGLDQQKALVAKAGRRAESWFTAEFGVQFHATEGPGVKGGTILTSTVNPGLVCLSAEAVQRGRGRPRKNVAANPLVFRAGEDPTPIFYSDGTVYIGESVEGRKHGHGRLLGWPNGVLYAGEWRKDAQHCDGSSLVGAVMDGRQ